MVWACREQVGETEAGRLRTLSCPGWTWSPAPCPPLDPHSHGCCEYTISPGNGGGSSYRYRECVYVFSARDDRQITPERCASMRGTWIPRPR